MTFEQMVEIFWPWPKSGLGLVPCGLVNITGTNTNLLDNPNITIA